jgi:hypothetical protein
MSETTRRITFSLDEIEDAEILAWLEGFGARKRSEAIRGALRAQAQRDWTQAVDGDRGDQAGDQAERIARCIVDKLGEAGVLVSPSGGISRTPDVDPVVRENLAGLGG